jgi:hypothetical protein
MGSLIALLGGGVMRLLPEVFKLFGAKMDHKHELEMTKLQISLEEARAKVQIEAGQAAQATASAAGELAAYAEALKGQSTMTGVKFIDGMNQSVRPVVTYWWMLLLSAQKFDALQNGAPVWTANDWDVLSMILGFWFVDRAIKYNVSK